MIERALLLRKPVDAISEKIRELHGYRLNDADWQLLKTIRVFLSYFVKLTKFASTARYPNLPGVIPYFNYAFDAIEAFDVSRIQDSGAQEILARAKQAAHDKLAAYYAGSHEPIITTATILDPRLKTDYFRACKWTTSEIKEARGKFASTFNEYKQDDNAESISNAGKSVNSDLSAPFPKNVITLDSMERSSEMDRYLDDARVEAESGFDVLAWWKAHETSYPTLARMARDFLAIPASSVPSERVFSSATTLVSKKRTRLSDKTIRATLCLKEWSRKDFAPNGVAMVEDVVIEPDSE